MDNIVSGFFCKSKAKIRDVQTSDKKVFHHVFHRPSPNRSHKSPEAEFKFLRMFYNIKPVFFLLSPSHSENSENSESSEHSENSENSEHSENSDYN